jgi:hypothetical protein
MLADLSSPFLHSRTVTPEQKWNAFRLNRSVSLSQVNLAPKNEVPAMENKPFFVSGWLHKKPCPEKAWPLTTDIIMEDPYH